MASEHIHASITDWIWERAESGVVSVGLPPTPTPLTGLQKATDSNAEERSSFSCDYLSLSPQSTNCALIVLHKNTVRFITASSQCLFSYWLKGLIKSVKRETQGQISESEVIRELVRYDDYTHIQMKSTHSTEMSYKRVLVLNHFLF